MKKILGILLLLLPGILLSCSSYKEKNIKICKINYVYDGDTFIIENGQKARLYGIDAPEFKINGELTKGQEFFGAQMAKNKLIQLIENKKTRIQIISKDKYKRLIVRLWANNIDVNFMLVKLGYARVAYINNKKNSIYNKNDENYLDKLLWEQKKAYTNKLFIWKIPKYFKKIFSKIIF